MIHISKEDAKKFLVNYQGLASFSKGKEAMEAYIQKVGCIQFDPLNVVGRNTDLVMQSRIQDYNPKMLEELLYTDRVLIDGWDKMMSVYHLKDWPSLKRVREAHVRENLYVMRNRGMYEALEHLDTVKEILRTEGAKFSREIDLSGGEKGRWSSNKYSNVALDHLYHMGEIGVAKKANSQKCFDVIENLVEEQILKSEDPFVSEDEFLRWYIVRRIGSVGMLWSRNGGGWLGHFISDKKKRDQMICQLVEEDRICSVQIEGIKDPLYIRKEDLVDLESIQAVDQEEIRILAPLDNLLWDRGLLEALFDFSYSWEVYVPQNKRKYGYYVLPVMYGENIVARFEPAKKVTGEPLKIMKWWWEEKVEIHDDLLVAVEKGLDRFSKYLGVSNNSKGFIQEILQDRK